MAVTQIVSSRLLNNGAKRLPGDPLVPLVKKRAWPWPSPWHLHSQKVFMPTQFTVYKLRHSIG